VRAAVALGFVVVDLLRERARVILVLRLLTLAVLAVVALGVVFVVLLAWHC